MKSYLSLVLFLCLLAGCGSAEHSPTAAGGTTPVSTPVSQPVPPPPAKQEALMVAVGFESGSYSYVATRWLDQHDNVFKAKSPISSDSSTDYARVWFPVPAIVPNPDTTLMRARYGCSNPRAGDIYFEDGAVSDVGSELSNGKPVFAVTVNELKAAYRVCGDRPVAIAFELYNEALTKIEAYIVVYLKGEPQNDTSQSGE